MCRVPHLMADAEATGSDLIGRGVFLLPIGKKKTKPTLITSISKSGATAQTDAGNTLKLNEEGKKWVWAPELRTSGICISKAGSERSAVAAEELHRAFGPLKEDALRSKIVQALGQETLVVGSGSVILICDSRSATDLIVELPACNRHAACVLLQAPPCMHDGFMYLVVMEPLDWGVSHALSDPPMLLRLPLPLREGAGAELMCVLPQSRDGFDGFQWSSAGLLAHSWTNPSLMLILWDGKVAWSLDRNDLSDQHFVVGSVTPDEDGGYTVVGETAKDNTYSAEDLLCSSFCSRSAPSGASTSTSLAFGFLHVAAPCKRPLQPSPTKLSYKPLSLTTMATMMLLSSTLAMCFWSTCPVRCQPSKQHRHFPANGSKNSAWVRKPLPYFVRQRVGSPKHSSSIERRCSL